MKTIGICTIGLLLLCGCGDTPAQREARERESSRLALLEKKVAALESRLDREIEDSLKTSEMNLKLSQVDHTNIVKLRDSLFELAGEVSDLRTNRSLTLRNPR